MIKKSLCVTCKKCSLTVLKTETHMVKNHAKFYHISVYSLIKKTRFCPSTPKKKKKTDKKIQRKWAELQNSSKKFKLHIDAYAQKIIFDDYRKFE